ncbi:torsin-1A-like [Aquarana catesbeiana]|uniref:torsin-1A-like n=1 Tax=Aquarana catesbeiana TaxID=8400 RepID=UPI003CCA6B17
MQHMAVMHKTTTLLLLLISSSLVRCTEQGVSQESKDAEEDSKWFSGAPEMQDLAHLSWEYVHELQCWLWPEKCDEMKMERADWSWKSFGWNALADLYTTVTSLTDPTQGTVLNNLTGLQWDLEQRVHGQHLAVKQILSSVKRFLQEDESKKSQVLSFHGWTGTGKNLAVRVIAENLYQNGLRNRCTKVFIPQLHFPHQSHMEAYKVQLGKQITQISSHCAQPMFVFDEADKLPAALLEPLLPIFKGDHQTRSILIFLSGIGSKTINEITLNFWHAGRHREVITLNDLEEPLKAAVEHHGDQLIAWQLLKEGLIDDFVLFLPLERSHVKMCARDVFAAQGLPYTESSLEKILQELVFVPKNERVFSAHGCKHVAQRIYSMKP